MRHWVTICFIVYFLLHLQLFAHAQDSVRHFDKRSSSKVKKAADDLKKSLSTDDEVRTAKQYEVLANELTDKGDYVKAEEYLKKAKEIYSKLKKENELSVVSRSLAKVQELQEKIKPAIQNYESAAERTKDSNLERVNLNDANRLRNSNPQVQQTYAQENALIFEKQGKKEEASDAYKQVAETQLLQNNSKDAVSNFKKAIEVSSSPKNVVILSNKMAEVYAADNQLDKAIALSKGLLKQAEKQQDSERQIDQLQELAKLFLKNKDIPGAETSLKRAYDIAFKSGNTAKAEGCVAALAKFYEDQNKDKESIAVYKTFVNNLDSIIKNDSSLIDAKLFELTEGRIKELEKEKTLQNELIKKKTRFNYFLIGSVVLMLGLLFLILRALYAIRIKNKRIALQSLRREMNPHFIFNSLNSVNQYIAENNELEANKYLTSYSSLMRNVMENSNKDFVSLGTETEQLKKYLELEHRRFRDKFDYTISIADNIDTELTLIPNMLIQPHLENAVWHGLRYKENKGKLSLEFTRRNKIIEVIITDNGIGLAKSQSLKTAHQKTHESRGITNTAERINLLNDLYKTNITMHMEEINANDITGTRVMIAIPLIIKK